MTIHFICRGNAFRSFIAESYFNSLGLHTKAKASGTVADASREENEPKIPKIAELIRQHGIDADSNHSPIQLEQSRLSDQDITVCMNKRVWDECNQMVTMPKRTLVWNINDVGESGKIAMSPAELIKYKKQTYDEITHKIDELIAQERLT